jgi:hypothetical protein
VKAKMIAAFFGAIVWWEWWLLLVVIGACGMDSGYDDHIIPASTTFVLVAAFMVWWFAIGNPFTYIYEHISELATYALYYIGIGVAWSFIKWIRMLCWLKKAIAKKLEEFKSGKETGWSGYTLPEKIIVIFDKQLERGDISPEGQITVSAKHKRNLSRLVTWGTYWPFSVTSYIFGKAIREIWEWIVNSLNIVYKGISRYIFRDITIK